MFPEVAFQPFIRLAFGDTLKTVNSDALFVDNSSTMNKKKNTMPNGAKIN